MDIVLPLDDNVLITKLEIDKDRRTICDFVAKEVMYHSMCRVELQRRAEQKSSLGKRTQWHQIREVHSTAFEVVQEIVHEGSSINLYFDYG